MLRVLTLAFTAVGFASSAANAEIIAVYVQAQTSEGTEDIRPNSFIGQPVWNIGKRLDRRQDKLEDCNSPCQNIYVWDFEPSTSDIFIWQSNFHLVVCTNKESKVTHADWRYPLERVTIPDCRTRYATREQVIEYSKKLKDK